MRGYVCGLIWIMLASTPPGSVAAQEAGETIIKTGTIEEDLYLAGGRVDVAADVEGDVIAAGGQVTVERRVTGDVMVGGGQVRITGEVLDDVRAAGGDVTLGARIGDDAVVAGGNIVLESDASVGGRGWFAGGQIDIGGRVARELKATGGTVLISGEIGGDAELAADQIEIGPTARIAGDLSYTSRDEARIEPGATIEGTITHRPPEPGNGGPAVAAFGAKLIWLVGLLLIATVLFLLFPDTSVSAARTIASDPWKSLGLGLVLLVTVPVGAVVLLITIVGIPLAGLVFMLYLLALLFGYLTAVLYIGDWGLARVGRPAPTTGWRVLSVFVALVALALVRLIPFLGALVAFVVLLAGFGALGLRLYRMYTSPAAASYT